MVVRMAEMSHVARKCTDHTHKRPLEFDIELFARNTTASSTHHENVVRRAEQDRCQQPIEAIAFRDRNVHRERSL